MQGSSSGSAARFAGLRTARVVLAAGAAVEVPVAAGPRVRLLGLSRLDLEDAGPGLLLPRCASVHTFGMRFALDLAFLDRRAWPLSVRLAVPPGRLVGLRGAAAVLELPAGGLAGIGRLAARSGDFPPGGGESGGAVG